MVLELLFVSLITNVSWAETSCREVFFQRKVKHTEDERDFFRDWNVLYFKENHPSFREPEYIELLTQAADPYLHGSFAQSQRSRELTNAISMRFLKYWHRLASKPKGKMPFVADIVSLQPSGTAANNNILLEVKERYLHMGGWDRKSPSFSEKVKLVHIDQIEVLHFDHLYGGVSGAVQALKQKKPLPSPYLKELNPQLSPKQEADITLQENKALEAIEEAVQDPNRHVAGLFLEPMTNGWVSIYFFRTSFLLKLRALADQYDLKIIADEIFVGGGRTGRFWAFEHYEGFLPDYVTFGKGLMLSGVAEIRPGKMAREELESKGSLRTFTTIGGGRGTTMAWNGLVILQSSQVLKTIYDGNLVQNAEASGKYFASLLKEKKRLNGIGLHLQFWGGRFLPPLDWTKEDIDRYMEHNKWYLR